MSKRQRLVPYNSYDQNQLWDLINQTQETSNTEVIEESQNNTVLDQESATLDNQRIEIRISKFFFQILIN